MLGIPYPSTLFSQTTKMRVQDLFPLVHRYTTAGEYRDLCYDIVRCIVKNRRRLSRGHDSGSVAVLVQRRGAIKRILRTLPWEYAVAKEALEDISTYPEVIQALRHAGDEDADDAVSSSGSSGGAGEEDVEEDDGDSSSGDTATCDEEEEEVLSRGGDPCAPASAALTVSLLVANLAMSCMLLYLHVDGCK